MIARFFAGFLIVVWFAPGVLAQLPPVQDAPLESAPTAVKPVKSALRQATTDANYSEVPAGSHHRFYRQSLGLPYNDYGRVPRSSRPDLLLLQ